MIESSSPCRMKNGGASGRNRLIGDASRYTCLLLGDRLLDDELLQERDELLASGALGGEPVVAAVDRHRGHHRGVGVLETRLPLRVVGRQRGQRAQMTARRATGDRNEIGVTAVVGDVLLDPGQRTLDVDDVVGPGVSGADPVVDRHAYPAALGEMAQQRVGLRPSHADRPCAAGHLQQHRRLAVAGQVGAPPDVGDSYARMRAVLDGAGLLDVAAADQVVGRHADQLRRRRPAATVRRSPRSRRPAPRAAAPRNTAATSRCGGGSSPAAPTRSP